VAIPGSFFAPVWLVLADSLVGKQEKLGPRRRVFLDFPLYGTSRDSLQSSSRLATTAEIRISEALLASGNRAYYLMLVPCVRILLEHLSFFFQDLALPSISAIALRSLLLVY
jgi:hypothetical protein